MTGLRFRPGSDLGCLSWSLELDLPRVEREADATGRDSRMEMELGAAELRQLTCRPRCRRVTGVCFDVNVDPLVLNSQDLGQLGSSSCSRRNSSFNCTIFPPQPASVLIHAQCYCPFSFLSFVYSPNLGSCSSSPGPVQSCRFFSHLAVELAWKQQGRYYGRP